MIIGKPYIQYVHPYDGIRILAEVESAARTCYKSEGRMTADNIGRVISNCIKNGHTSVLEHVQLSFVICMDNGILRELTRHRIASFSVESTRYCRYKDGVKFIEPIEIPKDSEKYELWEKGCMDCENTYIKMLDIGCQPQEARDVLNLSVACEMRFSINLRSLRNLLRLRCAKPAHAHMKQIFIPLLISLKKTIPIIFDDIEFDLDFYEEHLSDGIWRQYILASTTDEEWEDIIKSAKAKLINNTEEE